VSKPQDQLGRSSLTDLRKRYVRRARTLFGDATFARALKQSRDEWSSEAPRYRLGGAVDLIEELNSLPQWYWIYVPRRLGDDGKVALAWESNRSHRQAGDDEYRRFQLDGPGQALRLLIPWRDRVDAFAREWWPERYFSLLAPGSFNHPMAKAVSAALIYRLEDVKARIDELVPSLLPQPFTLPYEPSVRDAWDRERLEGENTYLRSAIVELLDDPEASSDVLCRALMAGDRRAAANAPMNWSGPRLVGPTWCFLPLPPGISGEDLRAVAPAVQRTTAESYPTRTLAAMVKELHAEHPEWTQAQVAVFLGASKSTVIGYWPSATGIDAN